MQQPRNQFNNRPDNSKNSDILTKDEANTLLKEIDGKLLFDKADILGKKIKDEGVTVSQIRKIYSEVKKLKYDSEGDYKYKLRLIKAQIGYSAGRFSKLKTLKKVLDLLINQVLEEKENEENKLKRFKDFFEAVIAYHRAYGGN